MSKSALMRQQLWRVLVAYLPVFLFAMLALGTYYLVRNTPAPAAAKPIKAPTHEPDYMMKRFVTRQFDVQGRLKSEVAGAQMRHYPDTDTMEIDAVKLRSFGTQGNVNVGSAQMALANADGSEVQMTGNVVLVREPGKTDAPRLEFRGEFIHIFANKEEMRSHLPVTMQRGSSAISADRMSFNNLNLQGEFTGRVRGSFSPRP
jgi:lipopolysaccharide export system protein LptC